ncbi:MAG: FAD-dependent oxidoreductase [Dehalococcoidia bacterium]|jgi:thioredoxin reductase (NADPH)|nr:FAD-dependent oxidoreductase [Dehalococcoidia bacterium]|tara:strand:- start:3245 stop:4198 length:954 start_codon:yes stop_codon:yes gene_type:complete
MNQSKKINLDVLIAGQGAAGFAAGLYSARYQMKTAIAGQDFGGETAIGGLIENYPGNIEIDGFDLMLEFKKQVTELEVPIIEDNLKSVSKTEKGFFCQLNNGQEIETKTVILAIGRERRKLGLKNEDEWTGKGVSYCSTCDAPLYKNKNLAVVVGGGNAAVEGAILIAKYAKKVFLVYRGEKLWRPEPILLETLNKTENVDVLLNNNVIELIGSDFGGLQKIKFEKEHNNETEYTVDGLMIEAGADPRIEIPNSLGIDLDIETNEVVVDKDQKTNIDGIYAAGDLTNGSNLKQTITAASQGAISALSAYNYCLENKN